MTAPDENVVDIVDLVKVYPGGTKAVAGIDFRVRRGEFVGFLGPNGAGKSTTLKIVATLLKKTSGQVMVAGHDIDVDPTAVRRSIGFAMQEVGLDDLSPGREFLVTQGLLYGLTRKEAKARADELLELVGLTNVANRKVSTYSGGMRRRIDLVGALMHQPPLVILDEPTSGLDPQSRIAIWDYLRELNGLGVTIFLTTQIMEEADTLCDRIAIMDQGTIVAEGTPEDLKYDVGGDVISVTVASAGLEDGVQAGKAEALARERRFVQSVSLSGDCLTVTVDDGGRAVPDLLTLFIDNAIGVTNLSVESPTLDDVFLKHTGRKIRESDADASTEMDQALRQMMGLGRR